MDTVTVSPRVGARNSSRTVLLLATTAIVATIAGGIIWGSLNFAGVPNFTLTTRARSDYRNPDTYPYGKTVEYKPTTFTAQAFADLPNALSFDEGSRQLTLNSWKAFPFAPPEPIANQRQNPEFDPENPQMSICPRSLADQSGVAPDSTIPRAADGTPNGPPDGFRIYSFLPTGAPLKTFFYPDSGNIATKADMVQPYAFDLGLRGKEPELNSGNAQNGALDTRVLKIAYFHGDTMLDIDGFSPVGPSTDKRPVVLPTWTVSDESIAFLQPYAEGAEEFDDAVELIPLRPGITTVTAHLCGQTITREITVRNPVAVYSERSGTFTQDGADPDAYVARIPFRPLSLPTFDTRGIRSGFELTLPQELEAALRTDVNGKDVDVEVELSAAQLSDAWPVLDGQPLPNSVRAFMTADGGKTWIRTDEAPNTPSPDPIQSNDVRTNRIIVRGRFPAVSIPQDAAAIDLRIRVYVMLNVGNADYRAGEALPATFSRLPSFTLRGDTHKAVVLVPQPPDARIADRDEEKHLHSERTRLVHRFSTYGSEATIQRNGQLTALRKPFVQLSSERENTIAHVLMNEQVNGVESQSYRHTNPDPNPPVEVDTIGVAAASTLSFPAGFPLQRDRLADPGAPFLNNMIATFNGADERTNPVFAGSVENIQGQNNDAETRQGSLLTFAHYNTNPPAPSCEYIPPYISVENLQRIGLPFWFSLSNAIPEQPHSFACERATYTGASKVALTTFASAYTKILSTNQDSHPFDQRNVLGAAKAQTAIILPEPAVAYDGLVVRLLFDPQVGPLEPPDQPPADGDDVPPADDGNDQPPGDDIVIPERKPLDAQIYYRGADRAIIQFEDPRPEASKDKPMTLVYNLEPLNAEHPETEAEVFINDEGPYAVLTGLQGGGFDEDDTAPLTDGRATYGMYVRADGGFIQTKKQTFQTLNRRQAILYTYGLVFGDAFSPGFDPDMAIVPPCSATGACGPASLSRPPPGEPLPVAGVQYALMNDALREFDIRLLLTENVVSSEDAVQQLYRVIHDRIYVKDLGQTCDPKGCAYWAKQVDRSDENRISMAGVKYALFASKEYQDRILAESAGNANQANAELAYQYVYKRAADIAGRDALVRKADTLPKMRKQLAQGAEFETRLKDIEEASNRRAAVNELYESIFGRAADVDGLDYWTDTQKTLSILEIRDTFLVGEDDGT